MKNRKKDAKTDANICVRFCVCLTFILTDPYQRRHLVHICLHDIKTVQSALIVTVISILRIPNKLIREELLPAEKFRSLDEIRRILQNGIQVIRPNQTRSQNQPFK